MSTPPEIVVVTTQSGLIFTFMFDDCLHHHGEYALALKGFSRHYDDAPGPWQRNYEIGRLWAAGMRVCGIDPPDWPEHEARQPAAITRATEEIARRIGALRPEIEGIKAPSDNLPVLHEPLQFRRGRIIERTPK